MICTIYRLGNLLISSIKITQLPTEMWTRQKKILKIFEWRASHFCKMIHIFWTKDIKHFLNGIYSIGYYISSQSHRWNITCLDAPAIIMHLQLIKHVLKKSVTLVWKFFDYTLAFSRSCLLMWNFKKFGVLSIAAYIVSYLPY